MSNNKNRVEAVGYMRTSSAANVGNGKDSETRQRAAIERHAKAAGFVIVNACRGASARSGETAGSFVSTDRSFYP
jgi:DNA invertase Pin-like site-specific DNA recombinase